jgi:hypothetical protein
VKVLGDVLPMTNSAFRAYRYAVDHPAFKDRDLTPKGTITERAAQGLDSQPKRRPPGDRPQGKPDSDERRGKSRPKEGGSKEGGSKEGGLRPKDQTRPGEEPPPRDAQRGGGPPGGRGRGFGRSLLAQAVDADGDGTLRTTEMENAVATLKRLDKNGDGELTADEMDDANAGSAPAAPDGRKRRPGGPLLRVLDTDRDGELSADEIRDTPAALLAADTNKDGKLTPEEVDATGGGGRGPGGGERR